MFRLTFLGTSSGVPTRERHVSGLAVECLTGTTQKHPPWLLIDCGEGVQYQLLNTPLKLSKLVAICITHLHGDHCYGLAGLLASMSMANRQQPLVILAPKALMKLLDAYSLVSELAFSYPVDFRAIEEYQESGVLLELDGSRHKDCHLKIDITALSHRLPSYAFGLNLCQFEHRFNQDKLIQDKVAQSDWHKLAWANPVYRQSQKSTIRLVVAGDNDTPSLLQQAVVGAAALVHESTYTQMVLDKILGKGVFNPRHSSAKMVADFAARNQIPTLILTHFSARYALFDNPSSKTANMGHIRQEVLDCYHEHGYSGRLILAHDLMQVLIGVPEVGQVL